MAIAGRPTDRSAAICCRNGAVAEPEHLVIAAQRPPVGLERQDQLPVGAVVALDVHAHAAQGDVVVVLDPAVDAEDPGLVQVLGLGARSAAPVRLPDGVLVQTQGGGLYALTLQ